MSWNWQTTTERLVVELAGKIPAGWADVISAVDRAKFIPARAWVYDEASTPQPLDRDTDPRRWRRVVHSDTAIMTQFDNGATVWPDTTATVAQQARVSLAAAGRTPTVITGDGTAGYPGGAPYDRIIATASVRPGELPYPWVTQTRPGGIIITPWGPDYHNGVLARLTVAEDGTASGRLSGNLAFMRLRAQQDTLCPLDDGETGDAQETTTTLWVYEVVGEFSGALVVGLLVPHCHKIVEDDPGDEYHHLVRVHDPITGSWATVDIHRGPAAYPVRQHGPRRLWDEIEQAHAWWVTHDRPTYTRRSPSRTQQQSCPRRLWELCC